MKKPSFVQIDIPTPCTQGRESMTPVNGGWHCSHCNSKVIDFTSWSDKELYNFFANNNDHVCGLYLATQVGRPIHIPYQPASRLYKLTIALGLTLIFMQTPDAQAQSRAPLTEKTADSLAKKTPQTSHPSPCILGTVVDEKKEPLISASVKIFKGKQLVDSTITDFDGIYQSSSLEPGYYDVAINYPGYREHKTTQVIVSPGEKTQVNFNLKKTDITDKVMPYNRPIFQGYKVNTILTLTDIQNRQSVDTLVKKVK